MLTWNAGGFQGKEGKPDDVAFIAKVLDDLATVVNVDPKRVYVTGMSNGGMMCYRLAAELSDRIAAIAPVAGTMAIDNYHPKRPVPVMHFHGTADKLVPFGGPGSGTPKFLGFKSVEDTIKICAKANGCPEEAEGREAARQGRRWHDRSRRRPTGRARTGPRWCCSSSRAAGIRGRASSRPWSSSASPPRTSRPTI